VSNALSGSPLVKPLTKERILRAAADMGYRPNSSARAMRNRRFGAVALVLSTERTRSHLQNGLLDGIHSALGERDVHLTVASLPDDKLTAEGFVPKILRDLAVDGLLINYTDHIPRGMIYLIEKNQIPSIWLNTRRAGDCVHIDDLASSRAATDKLIELGHRRIAYVDYHNGMADPAPHYSVCDRRAGYEEAMARAQLTPRIISEPQTIPPEQRVAHAMGWLCDANRPTAIVTYSPYTAVPVVMAALKCDVDVPESLSVLTFAEQSFDNMGLPLGRCVLPQREMGSAGCHALFDKIDNPQKVQPPISLSTRFEWGGTVSKPPSD